MLTMESSRGFSEHSNYPVYEYVSKSGKRTQIERFHDIEEHFTDYLRWIEEEHQGIPDSRFLYPEKPYGVYIGSWRNARWMDEAQRRGLSLK